ncbi:replication initiator protein A [Staphylococcus aureus]
MRNTEKSFIKYRKYFLQILNISSYQNDAKMAWGILRDRLDLSIKNGWVDSKTGNIYFYYKNENPQNILNCKKDKVI